jgi:hypothetical protein
MTLYYKTMNFANIRGANIISTNINGANISGESINGANICCNKQIIKNLAYAIKGTYLSNRKCMLISGYLFTMQLTIIYILLQFNIIFWAFEDYINSTLLNFLVNMLHIVILISVFYEIKILFKAFICKCD